MEPPNRRFNGDFHCVKVKYFNLNKYEKPSATAAAEGKNSYQLKSAWLQHSRVKKVGSEVSPQNATGSCEVDHK